MTTINLEDLTIAQCRKAAAMLNEMTPAPTPSPLARYVGQYVVVRDHRAGVYFGVVESTEGNTITLGLGSRQAHFWENGGSVPALAVWGPKGSSSRITPPSKGETTLMDVIQVCKCSPEAEKQVASMPEWNGK